MFLAANISQSGESQCQLLAEAFLWCILSWISFLFNISVFLFSLVVDTLKEVDPSRKCFRLIGGVLVERTVKEVLPALENNKEQVMEEEMRAFYNFFFKHWVLWCLIASYIVLRHLFNSKFNFLPPSVLTDLQNNRVHQLTDADEGAGAHRVQGTLQHTFGGRGRRRGKGPVSRSLQGQRRRRIQKRSWCFSFIGSEHGQWQQGPLISAVLNT